MELETVLPALVKLCASNNAKVKACVCGVIVMVANGAFKSPDSDVGLLVANVLSKDLNDPNPGNKGHCGQHDLRPGRFGRFLRTSRYLNSFCPMII